MSCRQVSDPSTWYIVTKSYGEKCHEGEVDAVEVGPAVLDVPEDDRRHDHEDEEARQEVAEDLEAEHGQVLEVVVAVRIFALDFRKL